MAQTYQLIREQWVPQSLEASFAFFSRPENLQAITPEWLDFRITGMAPELRAGALIHYRLRWRGVLMNWTTEISEWSPPHRFIDTQISGPYALWRHEHQFTPEGEGTRIRDEVSYALPFGIIGRLAHDLLVRRDVENIFDYRERRLRALMAE